MKKMKIPFSVIFIISLLVITACEKAPETPPVASFTVSADMARSGETISFQNASVSAKTFNWNFGDGNVSTKENPSHIYTETDIYTIQLEVSNSGGSDETSKGFLITLWSTGTPMPTG
jgi:PKD repeat protein